MISYKAKKNEGTTLADFGFGESENDVLVITSPRSPQRSVNHEQGNIILTTLKDRNLPSIPCCISPPIYRKHDMYRAVLQACERAGGKLSAFEYADIITELEIVDWRAKDSTIKRYISYLLDDGVIKRYSKGGVVVYERI